MQRQLYFLTQYSKTRGVMYFTFSLMRLNRSVVLCEIFHFDNWSVRDGLYGLSGTKVPAFGELTTCYDIVLSQY